MIVGIIMRGFVGAITHVVPATVIEVEETACTVPLAVTRFGTAPKATLDIASAAVPSASHCRRRIRTSSFVLLVARSPHSDIAQ
jgi:hypothetical protein